MTDVTNITADAVALLERDEFRSQGWLKLIAPAKVNLHLAIGARRDDGYHDAVSIMHALNLHDVVYMRRKLPDAEEPNQPITRLVQCGDVAVPDLPSADNIATKAVLKLAERLGRSEADTALEIRIEKSIPAQGGLGGGSSNAAAALVGAAHLWGLDLREAGEINAAIEETARQLGSDVAFFLHGGCSYYEGTGDMFVRSLEPSKRSVALVKPAGAEGVSTAAAYRTFDAGPQPIPPDIARQARDAVTADDIALFNNLAPASEALMPQLADIRTWLAEQPGVEGALLCGSGATTFAVCDDFATACRVVSDARKQGLWARATSFGSARAMIVST